MRYISILLCLIFLSPPFPALATEPLAEPRPVLKEAVLYTLADMNRDVAGEMMAELTGYEVEYTVMPQDNPSQKLLLDVASGVDYDLIKCKTEQFTALKGQGALVDLAAYVDVYGGNIVIDEAALASGLLTGADGALLGLPLMNNPTMENPYGTIRYGFAVREDMVAALGLAMPGTLAECVDFFGALRDAYGVAPLTIAGNAASVWVLPVLSAYGLGEAEWYLVDDAYVPRIRMPQMVEYLGYLQMLYREGLLDPEFPINRTENTIDKLASGKACATTMYFWDLPTVLDAFALRGLGSGLSMIGTLQKDDLTPASYYVDYGVYYIFCVPKSSRHVADAVHYLNLQSSPDVFLRTYLGEEGVQYEVVDGQYFPLFPGFEPYLNASQFTGLSPDGNEFIYWQARARKTPEMEAAFDQMNSKLQGMELVADYASYAYGMPGTERRLELNTMVAELLVEAIVGGGDAQAAMDGIIARWEAEGGLDFEAAMQQWLTQHREHPAFDFAD